MTKFLDWTFQLSAIIACDFSISDLDYLISLTIRLLKYPNMLSHDFVFFVVNAQVNKVLHCTYVPAVLIMISPPGLLYLHEYQFTRERM